MLGLDWGGTLKDRYLEVSFRKDISNIPNTFSYFSEENYVT